MRCTSRLRKASNQRPFSRRGRDINAGLKSHLLSPRRYGRGPIRRVTHGGSLGTDRRPGRRTGARVAGTRRANPVRAGPSESKRRTNSPWAIKVLDELVSQGWLILNLR